MPQDTAYAHKGAPVECGTFGCNGQPDRTRAVVNAAAATAAAAPTQAEHNAVVALLNQIRLALVNNGICI